MQTGSERGFRMRGTTACGALLVVLLAGLFYPGWQGLHASLHAPDRAHAHAVGHDHAVGHAHAVDHEHDPAAAGTLEHEQGLDVQATDPHGHSHPAPYTAVVSRLACSMALVALVAWAIALPEPDLHRIPTSADPPLARARPGTRSPASPRAPPHA